MIHLRQKSRGTMRKKSPSPAGGVDEFPDDSPDDVQVEAITPISSASDQPDHSAKEGPTLTLGSAKRLSMRGKAARALVTALVVIAARVVLPHPTFILPPGNARHQTLAPVQTPQSGRFSTGEWEQVAGPPVQTAYFYDLVPSPSAQDTAYACLFLESFNAGQVIIRSDITELWVTRDAGYTWRQ